MDIIRTSALSKFFGDTPATDGISLQVQQGEIYGFLGLNGAGKTTLIRLLLGMIKPDSGTISLFGQELGPGFGSWNDIGYLVETPYAYPELTVRENLQVYYQLRQLHRPGLVQEVIERLKLTPYQDKRAKVLSLGNQQRLGLAKALLHQPRLLILDEPINGLDPEGIVEVRSLLQEMARQGTTIFLSSHILGEISKLANRIGIIHRGKLIKELTTPELNRQLQQKLVIRTLDQTAALSVLAGPYPSATLNPEGELELTEAGALQQPESLAAFLVEKGYPPAKLLVVTEDLEHYFLRTIRS